jgi:thymidine kinase
MAKLYFRYGTVGSAKTLNLLAVAHNYRQQGKQILLMKPAIDTRFGRDIIATRAGLSMPADVVIEPSGFWATPPLHDYACILVDEVQFLRTEDIDILSAICRGHDIPVICYGLRTDFRKNAFPASQRLFEIADSLEEVKTTCHYCLRKAIFNLKLVDGVASVTGPNVDLGCEEKYLPTCAKCYQYQHGLAR